MGSAGSGFEDVTREPRFAVDCMLGSLARWLKILGYDTLYLNRIEDADLVARARQERRILLTRDVRMTERRLAKPCVLIRGERSIGQLREVVKALDLRPLEERILTRCLPCNVPTREVDRGEIGGRVPPYVLATQERFRLCPSCDRLYWGATHKDRMMERLREVFGPPVEADEVRGPAREEETEDPKSRRTPRS